MIQIEALVRFKMRNYLQNCSISNRNISVIKKLCLFKKKKSSLIWCLLWSLWRSVWPQCCCVCLYSPVPGSHSSRSSSSLGHSADATSRSSEFWKRIQVQMVHFSKFGGRFYLFWFLCTLLCKQSETVTVILFAQFSSKPSAFVIFSHSCPRSCFY